MKRALVPAIIIAMIFIAGCDEDSNKAPSAELKLEPGTAVIYDNGTAGTDRPTILFNGSMSKDDKGIANYHFDYGDGEHTDTTDDRVDREYDSAGYYEVFLEVEDEKGKNDRDEQQLYINYEARRSGFVENQSGGGNPKQTEEYSVSEYHPHNGTFIMNADDDSLGEGTDLKITFYNSTGHEIDSHDWDDVQDGGQWTYEMNKFFLNDWGYGDYSVEIEAKQGASNYEIEIYIFYQE